MAGVGNAPTSTGFQPVANLISATQPFCQTRIDNTAVGFAPTVVGFLDQLSLLFLDVVLFSIPAIYFVNIAVILTVVSMVTFLSAKNSSTALLIPGVGG